MNEILVTPDLIEALISAVRTELDIYWPGSRVGRKLPNHIPDWFVQIYDTGGLGRRSIVIDDGNVTIDVYATLYEDARALAQLARGIIHALADGTTLTDTTVTVYRVVDFSSPHDDPDPLTDKARASFTVQVTTRAHAIETIS